MDEKTVTGITKNERNLLREELKNFTGDQARLLGCSEEAIVQEIRYWQQSVKKWKTNPSKSQKQKSFNFYEQKCKACGELINSFKEATFHHLKRGIPNQHEPANMVPLHKGKDFGCHEKIHGAPPGSFTE